MARPTLHTLPKHTSTRVLQDLHDRLFDRVMRHDLDGLMDGLSEDYIVVLLTLDRALRTAGNLGLDEDLAWAIVADEQVRVQVGSAQWRADAVRLDLSYALGEICLVAGAGLSQAANMPGWQSLVIHLLRYAEEQVASDNDRDSLRRARSDLEAIKEYTDEHLRKATETFASAAGDAMNDWLRSALLRYYVSRPELSWIPTSQQHHVISNLVWSERPQRVTPGLNSIITYNFDDLIELHIAKARKKANVHVSVKGEWMTADYSAYALGDWLPQPAEDAAPLQIYHPHGFLPYYDIPDISSIDCVFSNSAYERHYGSANTFARRVQRELFRGTIALFVGTSFVDGNVKGELAEASAEQPGWLHYALICDEEAAADSDTYIEKSAPFRKFGIRPIFLSSFDHYPKFLRDVGSVSPWRWTAAWNLLRGRPAPNVFPAPSK